MSWPEGAEEWCRPHLTGLTTRRQDKVRHLLHVKLVGDRVCMEEVEEEKQKDQKKEENKVKKKKREGRGLQRKQKKKIEEENEKSMEEELKEPGHLKRCCVA